MQALRELTAAPSWRRIDFISDLHLAADTPAAFEAWRHYLLDTAADAVFILGDLFEAWVGDDARHEGFEARGAAVLTAAASRRPLHFMVGNRDFLVGEAMLEACGVVRLDDPALLHAHGERVLLTHGDAWCLGDVAYQQFRARVRDPAWQAAVLAKPLAERRAMARALRAGSERQGAGHDGPWVDVDAATALRALADADASTLVHGHTHRPGSDALAPGVIRHVLSDWHLDRTADARAEVLRWEPGRWTRLTPAAAAAVG